MNFRDFKHAGHLPTLIAAFLYFDFSFMVWVTLGPLMTYIAKDLGIDVADRFTLVAIPILSGAVFRIILGALADHVGGRRTAIVAQSLVIAAVAYAWLFGLHNEMQIEVFGAALGIAGASFAVALPQASRWYPPRYQGVVMGITGAGNMGVVLDALLVPSLAHSYGWQDALGTLLVPLVLTLLFYIAAAKDAPSAGKKVTLESYGAVLKNTDCWWFMFFYFITFGGFVGLANALPLYFSLQYGVSGVAAGVMAAIVVACGSIFRPVGGHVADRIGGHRDVERAVCHRFGGLFRSRPSPQRIGAARRLARMERRRHAGNCLALGSIVLGRCPVAGNGQWCRLSTRAATLPAGDRRRYRPCRLCGRDRRIFSREDLGHFQRNDRRILGRIPVRQRARLHRLGRPDTGQESLARDLGCRLRRTNLAPSQSI